MNVNIREDGRIEWVCEHGVGHTIALPHHIIELIISRSTHEGAVDSMDAHFTHGCDGCCSKRN